MTDDTILVIYDDDCGFCRQMLEQFGIFESPEYTTLGFSRLPPEIANHLPNRYTECFHIMKTNAIYSCGGALRFLLSHRYQDPLVTQALNIPIVKQAFSIGYMAIASNRGIASDLYSLVFDDD